MAGDYGNLGANSARDVHPVYNADAQNVIASNHSLIRKGPGKTSSNTWVNVYELMFIPWIILVVILVIYLNADNDHRNALWLVPAVLLLICTLYTYWRYKAGKLWEAVLGLLCFLAILAGLVIGATANANALSEYWRLGNGASYFNVLPTEPAAAKNDATTLSFSVGTKADTAQTYGFVDGHSSQGTIYCVAPVTTGSAGQRIQYWAAGTNCCFPRNSFSCGAVNDVEARGGIVLPKKERDNPFFKKAILGAQAAYGLLSGDDYLLVSWANSPVKYRNSLYTKTRNLFLVFGAVYLLISIMAGLAINSAMKQQEQ